MFSILSGAPPWTKLRTIPPWSAGQLELNVCILVGSHGRKPTLSGPS